MTLSCPGWATAPVAVPATFAERWRGLRPRTDGRGMVFSARSIHTVGMREPLSVVAIDRMGRVLWVRTVGAGRLVFALCARWIVELPLDWTPPPVGAVVSGLPE